MNAESAYLTTTEAARMTGLSVAWFERSRWAGEWAERSDTRLTSCTPGCELGYAPRRRRRRFSRRAPGTAVGMDDESTLARRRQPGSEMDETWVRLEAIV